MAAFYHNANWFTRESRGLDQTSAPRRTERSQRGFLTPPGRVERAHRRPALSADRGTRGTRNQSAVGVGCPAGRVLLVHTAGKMAARWNHVWIGAETGVLKGVNLHKKRATNYTNVSVLSRDQEVSAMCWDSPLESEVLLGCLNGTVKFFSTEKEKFTEFRDCAGGEGPFRGLATYDNSLITCVESGLLKVWQEGSTDHTELQVGARVCRMRQNPERRDHVATGGKENELRVWDLQKPQETVFTAKNVRNDWLDLRVPVWVRDIHFIPASDKLVSCTGHSQVRVYDPSAQRRPVLEMSFGEVPLTALSVTSDANSVVVGNTHGHLAILELRKGQLLRCLKGQAGSVRSVQCHTSLPLVASCGLDRYLRVHNMLNSKLQHKVYLKSRLNCLLFTSRENWEQEDMVPGLDADVKEEEEVDEIWDSMVTVGSQAHSKRKMEQRVGRRKKAALSSKV